MLIILNLFQKRRSNQLLVPPFSHLLTRFVCQVSAKKRLHSLVGRWQEAVHISESDKIKSDNMIKKKELRMLRTAFEKWKDMNSKFSTAEILADTLLMKR